jgi:hypothetical protein
MIKRFPAKRRIARHAGFRRFNRQKISVVRNQRKDLPPALADVQLMPARSAALFMVATG